MPVSIITAHFNRASLLAETAASVLAALGPDDEWIVVDDGSDPAEWERAKLLSRDPRVRWIARDREPKGPSACRNIGLAAARGLFVIFLDSDDLLAPDCLETRLAAATAMPDADLWVFPAAIFHSVPGDSADVWNRMVNGEDDLIRFLRSDGPWCVTSPMWRRDALLSLAGFNERVMYGDDAELHIRALLSGLRPVQYPEAPPDVFIRRSDVPRITQGNRPELVESRYVRLEEITQLLKEFKVPETRKDAWWAWEGQYFVEAEHLLFYYPRAMAGPAIQRVLKSWREEFHPRCWRRWVVRSYLAVALATKDRAYLLLRIARRIVRPILPSTFFA
jgi:glycosyltransferase involved in cell wall biosynthesis